MVTDFNGYDKYKFKMGQNIYIKALDVPDLWVSEIKDTSVRYEYENNDSIASAVKSENGLQIGFYILNALETQKVDLTEYPKNNEDVTFKSLSLDDDKNTTEKAKITYNSTTKSIHFNFFN